MRTHRLLLFVSFIIVLTYSSFINIEATKPSKKFVVVLDAGHGGHDSGNRGSGYKEKEIALKIVLEVGKQLEKNPDIKVVYTRKTDVFIDLFVRGQIANKANADLFVSVHCNSHNSQAHGTETFVLGTHRNKTNFEVAKKENSVIYLESDYEKNYAGFDPNSPESVMSILISQEEYLDQSIMLASLIQKKFTNVLKRNNRGVKQAGFIVLHQTVMPSVLVEAGFLTYKKEGAYLNSKKGQTEISTSIAKAVLEYKKSIDGNTGNIGNPTVIKDTSKEEKPVEPKEPKKSQEPKVTETIKSIESIKDVKSTNNIESAIVFKVQIVASSKDIKTEPSNFNGLDSISKIKEGYLYKYFYGSTTNYKTVKELEKEVVKKGYNSSFIVAFKDGKKIRLKDAIKSSTN